MWGARNDEEEGGKGEKEGEIWQANWQGRWVWWEYSGIAVLSLSLEHGLAHLCYHAHTPFPSFLSFPRFFPLVLIHLGNTGKRQGLGRGGRALLTFHYGIDGIVLSFGISNNFFFRPGPARLLAPLVGISHRFFSGARVRPRFTPFLVI